MGNMSPTSVQGSMPPCHNGTTAKNGKKRNYADYVDCPLHGYRPIDRPPSLVPRNHPSLYLPFVGHFPLRLRYPSQQSLPRHGSLSYTVQNNNFLQNPLIPPAPILGKRPTVLYNDFPQNPLIPPVPVQINKPTVLYNDFLQSPLIPPVPRGIQGNRTANPLYNNDFPQNLLSVPVPAVLNNFPQNPLIPPVPRGIQGSRSANLLYDNDFPRNPLSAPVPRGIQGSRPVVLNNDFPQNPPIAPVPVQGNWSFTADKHQFDVPSNEIPLEKTFIGAGQDDWVADWPPDKEPSHNDNGYLSEDDQSEDDHVQPYGFQMNQDSEVPQEFPLGAGILGADILAPPSPEPEAPQALALPPPPAGLPNAQQRMCKIPGCNQPTLAQTKRSSKCRDHLENPHPQSREAALVEAVATGHGYCSGCNGLRPRRAPGRSCWECLCKNRRHRFGVCDGCPASWYPNRVVEDA